MNPMQKKLEVLDWLIENFPNAFFKTSSEVKPLQIGIFDELMTFYERLNTPPFTRQAIREALRYYSTSPAYLRCQKAETGRIDLFGYEVDIVTLEQAEYAKQRYEEKYTNKKKSQIQAKFQSSVQSEGNAEPQVEPSEIQSEDLTQVEEGLTKETK